MMSNDPVFDKQSANAAEFTNICSNNRRAQCLGVRGDQKVVRANRLAGRIIWHEENLVFKAKLSSKAAAARFIEARRGLPRLKLSTR